jgi:biofilm PGA synthesis N-glycosyltransferase PgaC
VDTLALTLLVVSFGLLSYSYAGYPILLWLFGMFSRNTRDNGDITLDPWPSVSIIFSAHNEESVIGQRIENLLELEFPAEKLQILIGSDGSNDRTAEIIRQYRMASIGFHDFSSRRGKANVLNDLVARASGEYIVFTDANTFFDARAVKELLQGFRLCPSACAVVGLVELRTAEGTVNPDSIYWRYETTLKRLESRLGTVLGANGSIYAIKRAWFQPLPSDTIVDDFLIPLLIRQRGGGAIIFRPSARAWEMAPETVQDEFRRRVRIGAGDAHALRHTWRLLLPGRGLVAVCYWSHKVLRWMGPWLLLIAVTSNLWLLDRPWAVAVFSAQVSFYTLGFAAPLLRHLPLVGRIASGAWYFMVLNAALFLGAVKYITGRAAPVWKATPRTAQILQMAHARHDRARMLSESQEDESAA